MLSSTNTQDDVRKARYLRVRAAFIASGSNLNAWCNQNDLHIQNVRAAFVGGWKGDKAAALIARVTAAAGVE